MEKLSGRLMLWRPIDLDLHVLVHGTTKKGISNDKERNTKPID
jgi:hypothetical protein